MKIILKNIFYFIIANVIFFFFLVFFGNLLFKNSLISGEIELIPYIISFILLFIFLYFLFIKKLITKKVFIIIFVLIFVLHFPLFEHKCGPVGFNGADFYGIKTGLLNRIIEINEVCRPRIFM